MEVRLSPSKAVVDVEEPQEDQVLLPRLFVDPADSDAGVNFMRPIVLESRNQEKPIKWIVLKQIMDTIKKRCQMILLCRRSLTGLREEFQWKKFKLDDSERTNFTSSKWNGLPQSVFTALRCFLALYCTGWSIAGLMKSAKLPFTCQYSVIGQFLTTFYFIFGAALTEIACFKPFMALSSIREEMKAEETLRYRRKHQASFGQDIEVESNGTIADDVPTEYLHMNQDRIHAKESLVMERRYRRLRTTKWYHKLLWILWYLAINVTWISFFLVIFVHHGAFSGGSITQKAIRIHSYIMFPLVLLIDALLNAIPVHLLHMVYPLLMNLIFLLVAGVIRAQTGIDLNLLPGLSCREDGCTLVTLTACLLGSLLCHLLLFAVHKLKERLDTRRRTITFSESEAYTNPVYASSDLPLSDSFSWQKSTWQSPTEFRTS